jgi:hypothetical protein
MAALVKYGENELGTMAALTKHRENKLVKVI